MKVGERGRNRTYNLLIKSQLLCQLSYAPFLFRHNHLRRVSFFKSFVRGVLCLNECITNLALHPNSTLAS